MQVEKHIESTIKDSFRIFRNHYVTFIMATIIALLMMILIITIPPMIFGLYYIAVQFAAGKKVEISDIFKGFNYFFLSWGIFIVALIAIGIGFALLIIPGILLAILLQYTVAVAIMEKKGVFASIRRSYEIGKKNFVFSIVLCIFLTLLSSLGAITYIGALLTCPFSILITVVAAKHLTKA